MAGRNLEQNRPQKGNRLPLVGTGFNLVHLDSSHLGTWARAPDRCPEQGEKKENIFREFRYSLIKQSRKDRGACVG